MAKGSIPPSRVSVAQSMASDFQSNKINVQLMDRVCVTVNVLSGTAVGVFNLQGRASLSVASVHGSDGQVGPSSEWIDLDDTAQASPGNGFTIGWDVGYTGMSEIRVSYVSTSGTGTCDIWISVKAS